MPTKDTANWTANPEDLTNLIKFLHKHHSRKALISTFPPSYNKSPHIQFSAHTAPVNIPISPKKDGTIQWDTFAACTPDKPVPIYDARSVDFDIKNFQQLPKYDGELDAGMVAMVVFALGRYSGADSEKLSLNVQAAVAMHDAVPEEDRPAETVIDARMPLPIV
ncbi:hypothetical protein B0H14DRAFT_2570138 [Mycena olivaceomarginata]|nr:hypothetical protein B0H14DRAFT_2570138 [Mycena olivaceomarginata]